MQVPLHGDAHGDDVGDGLHGGAMDGGLLADEELFDQVGSPAPSPLDEASTLSSSPLSVNHDADSSEGALTPAPAHEDHAEDVTP
ncbi:unnamed protein product [Linum trigynum]|uniref:Uncharacterized protein n=1 Tax=Linum trigynum TaxID=586398 RepID=A0AAV2ERC7_9ROSI